MRYLLMLVAAVAMAISGVARAQDDTQPIGWISMPGPVGIFPTAHEACEAQWKKFANGGYDRFIGAIPYEDDWRFQDCEWTRYQYLCPQENPGAGFACGTIIPGTVRAHCESGYTPTLDGFCRLNPGRERPRCDCDEDGRVNPAVGNPVMLASGAKMLEALDYETADGLFRIARRYRSFQVGRPIQGAVLPRALPKGLAGGWNFDFNREIQLGTFSGSPSSPNATVAILLPDGSGYGFVLQANGQWIEDPSAGTASASGNLKLEFVGTLPSNLSTIRSAPSTWKLTDGDDVVWTLQTRRGPNGGLYLSGWPTQMVARSGYTQTFTYSSDDGLSSITDSFGRTATFTWEKLHTTTLATPPAGRLPYPTAVKSIGLPDGTSLHYMYHDAVASGIFYSVVNGGYGGGLVGSSSVLGIAKPRPKRLYRVERRAANDTVLGSESYHYENTNYPGNVTGIRDHRDVRISTYIYDSAARVISSKGPDDTGLHAVQYGASGSARTRRVVNPLGKAETYTYGSFGSGAADYRLTQVAGEASAQTPASSASLSYGGNTFIASQTDANGRVLTTSRDARGRPLTLVEASGTAEERTTTIAYHSTFNVPATITRPGLTETRTYTATGRLETVTQTDTTTHSVPYATNGQTRTWTYDWDANGRLLSINGPLAPDEQGGDDVTSYTYDTGGNLLTSTDALGHVFAFAAHDANGRPATTTDSNGIVTAYGYDALGRIETITVQHPGNPALNASTAIDYDAVGQVIGLTLPSTDTLLMDYDDAGRLTSMRAADGERWDFAYDAMGNITRETVKRANGSTSQRITRAFDELGRLIRETTGVGHTAQLAYDKVDNVVASISPNGHATTVAFDALDRVIETVAPDGGTTELAFDDLDNLVSHTDPISVTTQFVHNGFGGVIQEVSPDRGTSTYVYDAAGQLIEASDGRGQVVVYSRDYLGRVTSKTPQGRPTSEIVQYVWDTGGLSGSYEAGRLAKVVDGSGATLFRYDHRGNLLAKQQTIGASSAAQLLYEYDLADRITQITYPSGRLVHYGYDSKGRVNLVETKASSSVGSWTPVASGHTYEPFGAITAMTLGNGLAVANEWDSAGLLDSRRLYRTLDGSNLSYLSYRHDADGNIGGITDHLNTANTVAYGYDEVGRLTLAVMDSGGSAGAQSYSYTSGTNQLASMTDASGTRTIAYDARGNTASEARPGSITVTADYDGHGRLIEYDRSNAGAQAYVYNGLDDRVTMVTPTATRHFVYDADGRVLGEYGVSATDVHAEFIWAQPELATGAFGGSDGIGGYAPLAVATPATLGGIQINWVHGNHLGVPLVTTDPAGNVASTPDDYLAPGFPGQSRVFADLYYNRYRDYDPVTGRYIQADPIGLEGGANAYLYAEANPLNVTDPTGNCPWCIPILGALAWGGLELGFQALDNWFSGRDVLDPDCYEWGEVAFAGVTGALGGGWVRGWVRFTPGSMKWNNVSRRIRRAEDLVGKDVDLHHWLVPRKWGDGVGGWRDRFINRPWNLHPLPRQFHREVVHHGNPIAGPVRGAPPAATGAFLVGAGTVFEEVFDGD